MPPLPTPVYSHNGATGTGPGNAIDIGSSNRVKPVFLVKMTGNDPFQVLIEGSPDGVTWADWSQGGHISSVAKRLELGVQYWRTNILVNGGTVTSVVGRVPGADGGWNAVNNTIRQTGIV